ncbi:tRNA (cmo5U34)-methyltransferase [Abditibacteriota bacterium]|nr:tRNA (cmo5U34)-methyltransferase [Abditibacteriota bacterium]
MSATAPAIFDAFARDYDASRHRLVPDFDRFYSTVTQILEWRFPHDNPMRVLDLGAGTGLLSTLLSRRFPQAKFVLADGAPQMLERARERFAGDKRFEFVELDFGRDELPPGFDCVVSSLAIHHLEPDELEPLFRKVFSSLREGGLFVNADQTRGDSAHIEENFEQQWRQDAREVGASEEEILGAIERMKADRNAPLEWQLGALRKAGFKEVECFYKRFRFAVYSGW